jgi:hypothetical protein
VDYASRSGENASLASADVEHILNYRGRRPNAGDACERLRARSNRPRTVRVE